jgi:hypothetical protein
LNHSWGSVPAKLVSLNGSVNAVDLFAGVEVPQILDCVRSDVDVVVSSFAVVAEAVEVLDSQVQPLENKILSKNQNKKMSVVTWSLLINVPTVTRGADML